MPVVTRYILLGFLSALPPLATAQPPAVPPPAATATTNDFIEFTTPDFNLKLAAATQTIAALQPKGADGFDFTPGDQLTKRSGNGYFQLGDLTLRLRENNAGEWRSYSTAAERQPVIALPVSGNTLAAADLTPTLPDNCPLQITRTWALDDGPAGLEISNS